MKGPNRTAKTVMSAITKTHTPSTPGSRRVGSPAGMNWVSVSELINDSLIKFSPRLINTLGATWVTAPCLTIADRLTPGRPLPTAHDGCELRSQRCRIARTGAATNQAPAPWCRLGSESGRPRGPAIHRGAALELTHAPTNILDQVGARNYFPTQPAEVREVVAHDAIPGEGAGLQNAGEARREEADCAEDGEVADPVRHERRGLVLAIRQNWQGERQHLQRGARILKVDDQPADVGEQLDQLRV